MKTLLASIVLLISQTFYVNPTPDNPFNPNGDQRKLLVVTPPFTGPVLLQGVQTPMYVAAPTVMFVVPNAAVGQAAVDACVAGRTAPGVGPGGIGLGCEFLRQPAIFADDARRVNAAIMTIAPAVLQAHNLYVAGP